MSSKRRSKQPAPETPQAPDSKQELVDLVSNLPEERRRDLVEVLAVSTRIEQTFSGPLPVPADFEHYNKVLPDAAHRIMAMAEKEQQIRADGQAGMLANDRRRINGATGIGLALIGTAPNCRTLGSGSHGIVVERVFGEGVVCRSRPRQWTKPANPDGRLGPGPLADAGRAFRDALPLSFPTPLRGGGGVRKLLPMLSSPLMCWSPQI